MPAYPICSKYRQSLPPPFDIIFAQKQKDISLSTLLMVSPVCYALSLFVSSSFFFFFFFFFKAMGMVICDILLLCKKK